MGWLLMLLYHRDGAVGKGEIRQDGLKFSIKIDIMI